MLYGKAVKRAEVARARATASAALAPDVAVAAGGSWWLPRKPRSDKLSDHCRAIVNDFFHSSRITRTSGNTKEVKSSSKRKGAEVHSVHRLLVTLNEAYRLFLQSNEYAALKAEEEWEENEDIGRKAFLNMECWCIVPVSVTTALL
jgi:hypothetical protein